MAKNWAIVIGINDYLHHPERKLNYAVNDAQQMSKFLSDRAGFGAEQVIQCLGDEVYRGSSTYPTCDNLLRVLKRDLKPACLGKIDRFWFYFSGHGVSRNGRDYLITSNCLEDEIERFALPIDEVIAALQLHKDAEIVLILDACRQVLGKKNFDSPIGEETSAAAKERGITTIFSCDYGQYSYELEALQQGAFTYALIEGLAQHTLPHQLETYLRQRVPALHLQHRRDRVTQTPRIRIEPASKAFHPLLPDTVTSTDIEVLVDRAREAELEEDFETARQVWWQVIEVSQSSTRIREARTAIDRIDRKMGGRSISIPATPSISSSVTNRSPSLSHGIQNVERCSPQQFDIPSIPGTQTINFSVLTIDIYGQKLEQYRQQNQCLIESLDQMVLEMVVIPSGNFLMGSLERKLPSNEVPVRSVKIRSFLMGRYPITKAQWKEVAALKQINRSLKKLPSRLGSTNHPIVQISWYEAVEFCDRLSQKTGHTYRLPSEAEWEYACRAGTTTPFHFGETITSHLANYDGTIQYRFEPKGNHHGKPMSVGSFSFANGFGLSDMHGNVWEWCLDHWHETYEKSPTDGRAWLGSPANQDRVMRGGSWRNEPILCRSTSRIFDQADSCSNNIGFRIVREL